VEQRKTTEGSGRKANRIWAPGDAFGANGKELRDVTIAAELVRAESRPMLCARMAA